MRKSVILFLCIIGCHITSVKGNSINFPENRKGGIAVIQAIDIPVLEVASTFPDSLKKDTIIYRKKHRVIAAILAFPPFGLFGLHRIYMHTSPQVPFIYIVTAGGLFGVLPFIDFVLILLNKDIHLTYTSNPHLFMWQKRDNPQKI